MSEIEELLERFRRGPEVVAVAITGAAGRKLDHHPAPGKWSVRQILCHLLDAELVGATRFRRVIAEEKPRLEDYDQDAWANGLHYEQRRVSNVMELFRKLRAANHALLSELSEKDFARTGDHAARGVVTLRDLLVLYVEHTEAHAAQMQEARHAYKASQAAG